MTQEVGAVVRRTRKRTWALLGLGALILGVVVWSALGGPGLGSRVMPDPPPLPNPNGYDDLLEAARAIEASGTVGTKLDLAKADEATLAPVVEANHEAIARAEGP